MMTLPLHVEQQVMHIAQLEHIAPESVLEQAMQSFIKELEDREDIKVADAVMAKLLTGEEKTLSQAEAMRMLDELGG